MASFSEEENEIIRKDREENPGCFYSTAYSSSCRTINGESKCETIKKIFRQCPGKRKELIINKKEVTEDEHGGEMTTDFYNRENLDKRGFGDFFGSRNPFAQGDNSQEYEAEMNPFDFLRREMLRPFEGFFGGGGLFGGDPFEGFDDAFSKEKKTGPFQPSQRTRQEEPPATPPHYSYHPSTRSRGEARQGEKKKDAFEGYTGPVEEI